MRPCYVCAKRDNCPYSCDQDKLCIDFYPEDRMDPYTLKEEDQVG